MNISNRTIKKKIEILKTISHPYVLWSCELSCRSHPTIAGRCHTIHLRSWVPRDLAEGEQGTTPIRDDRSKQRGTRRWRSSRPKSGNVRWIYRGGEDEIWHIHGQCCQLHLRRDDLSTPPCIKLLRCDHVTLSSCKVAWLVSTSRKTSIKQLKRI